MMTVRLARRAVVMIALMSIMASQHSALLAGY
jgi:hypothetical protein